MTNPGRIVAGTQFAMTREFVEMAPADVVRRAAAKQAGNLLTELLLNPEADPFTDLQLRAESLRSDFLTDTIQFRVKLSCAAVPKQYVPIAGGQTYAPAEYVAEPKELE